MIDLEFLQSLIRTVDESGVDSVEVSRAGTRVRISKTPPSVAGPAQAVPTFQPAPAIATAGGGAASAPAAGDASVQTESRSAGSSKSDGLVEITSPMVGTFYRAPAPEAPAYVEIGSRVSKGQTLCILEAMKLMNELECEVDGTIREICVENTEPVEYGQVLFRVEPEA